jgi:1-acyl-sn-glycerol-3-phosphate acyltransferase
MTVTWLEPSADHLARVNRRVAWLHRPARALLRPLAKLHVEGLENVPRTGPVLLLANHATLLDPITLILAAQRPIQWMGTETLQRSPVLGPLHRWMGTVPKKRFFPDVVSVWLLRQWVRTGAMVGVFPEGERTWTGRLQPFLPGLAHLVKLLGAPVLLARMENHYRHWPRWATRPRRGAVAVRFLPPRAFDNGTSPEAVRRFVEEGLTTDPRSRPDLVIRGRRLAVGLSNLIFACPKCEREAMTEHGDRLQCTACGASWNVDSAHRLLPDRGDALLLEEEMVRIQQRFVERWAALAPATTPIMESVPLDLEDHTDGQRQIAHGRLVLYRDRLAVEDGTRTAWATSLAEVVGSNVEFQRVFEIRTSDRYLKATIPTGSAWKWPWAVDWWARNG